MHTLSRRLLVPLTASTLVLTGLCGAASAAPDLTTGVELNVDEADFVAGAYTFNPSAGTTEGARGLKELRGYMWDVNPQFRGYGFEGYTGTLRDAAREEGITSKEQYLAVSVDEDLNWIAVQRAVEATAVFAHERPDGSDITTAVRNGRAPKMESLAVGTRDLHSTLVDDWGKGELADLNANQGRWTGRNGHLVHLIHPRHRVWGFGAIDAPASPYRTSFAAVNADSLGTPATTGGQKVTRYLHRAATDRDTPTGLKAGTPPSAPAFDAADLSASSSTGEFDQIIWVLMGAIPVVLGLLGALGQFLPR